MSNIKEGKIIKGTVTGITSYGVFVSCDEYYTGLIHISELSNDFVKDITDYVKIGDVIKAQVLDVDDKLGHLRLSVKNINHKSSNKSRKKKIKETPLGFKTLEYNLPIWIEKELNKIENQEIL